VYFLPLSVTCDCVLLVVCSDTSASHVCMLRTSCHRRGTWYACLLNFTSVTTRRSLVNNSNYKPHVSPSGVFSTTTTTTTTITTSNELLLLIITIIVTNNNVDCRKMTVFIFTNCVFLCFFRSVLPQ